MRLCLECGRLYPSGGARKCRLRPVGFPDCDLKIRCHRYIEPTNGILHVLGATKRSLSMEELIQRFYLVMDAPESKDVSKGDIKAEVLILINLGHVILTGDLRLRLT